MHGGQSYITFRCDYCTLYNNHSSSGAIQATYIKVSNSIIWGTGTLAGSITGSNNICSGDSCGDDPLDVNPLFKNPGSWDFSLTAGSPGIDAAFGTSAPEFDILGMPRVDVPAVPNRHGEIADIGAFEFQP